MALGSQGFRVQGAGCRVHGSRLRVQGSEFRVQGAGFGVQGSGFIKYLVCRPQTSATSGRSKEKPLLLVYSSVLGDTWL